MAQLPRSFVALHDYTLITKATRPLPPPDHAHYVNRLCNGGALTRLNPFQMGSPSWGLAVFEVLHCCLSTMDIGQMKKPARKPSGSIIFSIINEQASVCADKKNALITATSFG